MDFVIPASAATNRLRRNWRHIGRKMRSALCGSVSRPPELIAAFIDVESRWNPRAVSNKGAMGLMQLMPATARRFGAFQPFDAEQNIAAGTRYVTTLMWEFHGDLRLVAAAYYAGDHWILRKQLNYDTPDVVAYVQAVRRRYLIRRLAAASLPGR